MYETLILIDRESTVSADEVESQLKAFCARPGARGARLTRRGQGFELRWPGFTFTIERNASRHVQEESREIAQHFAAGLPQRDSIAACAARFEIIGLDDPGMDYFNDYCMIVESIESLGTVYTFDSGSTKFMNL